jgi:3-hydroxyanthranilic acid dioxygenase
MKPLLSFSLWKWVEDHRHDFDPPVGNKVIWEDSQFTAMIIRGPNASSSWCQPSCLTRPTGPLTRGGSWWSPDQAESLLWFCDR